MLQKVLITFFFAILFITTTGSVAAVTKIMPLGDSITSGVGDATYKSGYRYELYNNLKAANVSFDFVGSQVGGTFPDNNHEGYPSRTISQIAGYSAKTVPTYQPDVVLLLAGTNNVKYTNANIQLALTDLEKLIDNTYTQQPTVTILVSSIPPMTKWAAGGRIFSPLTDSNVKPYNTGIVSIVEKKKNVGKKIYFVDNFSVLIGADFADDLHPNTAGYKKMATKWNETLKIVLGY